MKKIIKLTILLVVISLNIGIFNVCGYAMKEETPSADVIKYNGAVKDLPEHIYDAYSLNEKAESLDVYDQNLYSLTTNNTDGTKTVEIYQTPIKYIEDNEIKFIDTSLVKLSVFEQMLSGDFCKCDTSPVKTVFPKDINDGVFVENGSYSIKCLPNSKTENKTKLFSEPSLLEENKVVYDSVFSQSDEIAYTPVSNGIKEEIVLNECPQTNILEFHVELEGLQPACMRGDAIPLTDKSTGKQIAAISQVDMRDSSIGKAFNTSLFNYIELELIEKDTYLLRVVLDDEFLKSESTVYPVIIDPTITFDADPIYDAPVFSGYPTTNFNSNTYNVVGYHGSNYGEGIAFVKINNIQNYVYIKPENISSAYLKVYEGSGKTSSVKVGVYDTKATWDNTTITYSNMPELGSSAYSTLTISESGWYNFNITSSVKKWLQKALGEGGKSQNYGFALKMETSNGASRHFCSANNSSYPPSIVINYTEYAELAEGNYIIKSQYRPDTSKPYCYLYASGSNVVQYTAKGNKQQIWRVDNVGNGYYEIYSTYTTSKALGVASSSPENGTNVGLYDSSAGNRRKFRIVKNSDNSYRILSVCGNKIEGLNVEGPGNTAGINIETKKYTGEKYQQWRFYKAAPCGYLEEWYSDGDIITHFAPQNIKVYVSKDSDFYKLESTLKSYVEDAMEAWSDLGYTYTFVDSASESNIRVRGISRETAIDLNIGGANTVGYTSDIDDTGTTAVYEGEAFSSKGWKSVYSTTKRTVYLIWDSTDDGTAKTSGFSAGKWKALVAHEIGHALGYYGHDNTTNSLMQGNIGNVYNDEYKITEPTSKDIGQLIQVY